MLSLVKMTSLCIACTNDSRFGVPYTDASSPVMSRTHSQPLLASTQGIRVIKAYAWERPTATMIQVTHA